MTTIKPGWNVCIEQSLHTGKVHLYIMHEGYNGLECLAYRGGGLNMVKVDEGERYEPTLTFHIGEAKAIFKELAAAISEEGFVSASEEKKAGLLEAKDSHLEDMRKIAFKQLGL